MEAVSSQPKAPGVLVCERLFEKWSSQPRSWLDGNGFSNTPKYTSPSGPTVGEAALEVERVGARDLEPEVDVARSIAGDGSINEDRVVVTARVQIIIRNAVEGELTGGARGCVEVVAVVHGPASAREVQPSRGS